MGPTIRVAEMFAGVGGFRLGLEGYSSDENPQLNCPAAGPFETVWANQWEPPGTDSKQFAWRCYEKRFGKDACVNQDINVVLDEYEAGKRDIPDFDLLVGGFPCQDYSVAKPLSQAQGIEGKKGVLWWDIYRMLRLKKPKYALFENVDRLLKSPRVQRGRDFSIILSCLANEGYSAEWRVINAAEYGMPQRRRRVFIFAARDAETWNMKDRLSESGVLASAFPIARDNLDCSSGSIPKDPAEASASFGLGERASAFQSAGVMQAFSFCTAKVKPLYDGPFETLGDIIVDDSMVPESYFIPDEKLESWIIARSSKKITRTTKAGFTYTYSEGAMAWPDSLDRPARTILTAEGGAGASRMKHAIKGSSGRYRRLIPDELDKIQMFPAGWTNSGMSDARRAFCMGNALVVGIPHRIGMEMSKRLEENG